MGYAFQSLDVVDIPAYSGKPVNIQVLMDAAGVIQDAYVLEHHEPILLIGIPEERLHEFTAKYQGISADQLVVVGRSSDPDAVTVDAVTGATVTVMVVNEIIMRSAHDVAVALGLVEASAGAVQKPAVVREDVFEPASWSELTGNGAIRRLHLTHGDVDEAFKGTEAEGLDEATPEEAGKNFIDLYVAHLNPPTISRNLLGENQYRFLMEELEAGEHAVAVLGRGEYSFKVPAMCMAGSSIGYSCVNSATSSASAIGITSGWLTCTPKECPNSPKWQSSSSVSTTGFWGEGHKRSEVF
ncbi:FMN-binding protein [Modicisalibacter luteus]|uniref:FMN-binding protein n=1 Tax=Modicisalibacter luteus TaxID=453962 RepID=UPI003625CE27